MPDITSSKAVRNSGAVLTMNAATASQTINVGDVADERAAIVVLNSNTGATNTATITIAPGDFLSNVYGTLSVEVAKDEYKLIGPLESARYKDSASKLNVGVSVTASGTVSSVTIGVVKL